MMFLVAMPCVNKQRIELIIYNTRMRERGDLTSQDEDIREGGRERVVGITKRCIC